MNNIKVGKGKSSITKKKTIKNLGLKIMIIIIIVIIIIIIIITTIIIIIIGVLGYHDGNCRDFGGKKKMLSNK